MVVKIETIRHSLAHILAYAVRELYPGVKFGIGPAIENGFYYDFDFSEVKIVNHKSKISNSKSRYHRGLSTKSEQIQNSNNRNSKQNFNLSIDELQKIEKKMRELIKNDLKFVKRNISKAEAKKIFKNQPYKLELIKDLSEVGPRITYQVGDFVDLCKGPHVKSTKKINPEAFKLTKLAGAYWKGDEKNPMLTRIYGLAFGNKKELSSYLKIREEAEKRDHRKLGANLELFLLDEEIGLGLPIWLPKGAKLRHIIEDYLYRELSSQDYQWLYTPHIGKLDLWKKSGHWNFYKENLYSPIQIDEEQYLLKPMNCPFHVKVYNSKIRSYKDLPLRFAELGTVYRYEKSGVLHGLTRVRGFTQDDAHLICSPAQIGQELEKLVKQGLDILNKFGFKEYNIYLSTRPEKYAGEINDWKKAIKNLKYVLEKLKLKYQVDPAGGVFYGPKIDIKIKDALGREWQCTTIQFDFNLPERFEMAYINEKGKKEKPYMIHRALLGSIERFIGVLLEHYEGALPFWLSPVQVWIIPVGSRHQKYARDVGATLRDRPGQTHRPAPTENIRVEIIDENETVSKKIRDAEIQKIPYVLVVGDKEMKEKSVRVRQRRKGDIGMMKLDKFLKITETESL